MSDKAQPEVTGEIVDINLFQARLQAIRKRNREATEYSPAAWAQKMAEMRENLVRQREQMEDALLEQMLAEEKAMLDRLAGVERNLRNMIRLYKQLMDERNAMVSGIEQLHSWLRQLELKQGKKPHREHGPDLTQKFLVEYLSKQAWIFDNQGGWGVEEVPQQPRGTAVSR